MISNEDILAQAFATTGCKNDNQLATFLSKKYARNVTRQQIKQFRDSKGLTVTHMLLREFLEALDGSEDQTKT